MNVKEKVEALISEADANVPQKTRRQKIRLYAEGVKSKMRQAEYALSQLTSFSDRTDATTTSTAADEYGISERVEFYCDSFWAFLYSSLDVLAHVINQSLKLGMKEKYVSFKRVSQKLNETKRGTVLQKKVDECLRSIAFKNVDAYRNCSTHRRAICIEEEIKIVRRTAGYNTTATGSVESVIRVLCDKPLVVTPTMNQQRKIPQYLVATKNKITKQIATMLENIKPVK
jgi:hypothetical protein